MKKSTIKSLIAYKMIRDGILSGEFLPGSRLILSELEQKLGLGRGPIRDALMRLDRSGLIENIPFKGAIVKSPPSLKELEYIYTTRLTIEKLAIAEAMSKANTHHLSSLQKMVNISLKEINIPQNFYFHDRKFHAYLYTIANMPHIQDIINTLNEHIDIFLNTHIYDYDYREESILHHQNIVDAIREKDEEKLFSNLEANMTIGLKYLYNRLGGKEIGHALSEMETCATLRMTRVRTR
ncbi:GntR family transcriptional regulator [Bilophila wadsworthia]|uniref:GntR family transcriptional regulator n=1 Tax=Bilophila wadsworthia TaxID=35833 RepID=UPI0035220650